MSSHKETKAEGRSWLPEYCASTAHHHETKRWWMVCLMCGHCNFCDETHAWGIDDCPHNRWRKRTKEMTERWDSRRSQLMSGTSQNPAPLSSPSGSPIGLLFPHPSPSENPSVSLLETRRETPVIGYRMWSVREGFKLGIGKHVELRSMNEGYGAWTSGINAAVCYASAYSIGPSLGPVSLHGAPDATCHCGFYVLSSLDSVPLAVHDHLPKEQMQTNYSMGLNVVPQQYKVTVYPQVAGVVVGWGRVIQHGSEGWRAQYAKIVALLDCKISPEHLEMTRHVAELFHVPVLSRSALEMLAREYGDPLPVAVTA